MSKTRTAFGVPLMRRKMSDWRVRTPRSAVEPFTQQSNRARRNLRRSGSYRHREHAAARETAPKKRIAASAVDSSPYLDAQLEQRVSDQVGEIERMGQAASLPTYPQVADLIVASGTEKQLESHRREITATLLRPARFDWRNRERRRGRRNGVVTRISRGRSQEDHQIQRHARTIRRRRSDGDLNDPVPVENPALQAVLMALEIPDTIGALTETRHRWATTLASASALPTALLRSDHRLQGTLDYAAIGTVSNVALGSRLCDEGKPGQILIGPRSDEGRRCRDGRTRR